MATRFVDLWKQGFVLVAPTKGVDAARMGATVFLHQDRGFKPLTVFTAAELKRLEANGEILLTDDDLDFPRSLMEYLQRTSDRPPFKNARKAHGGPAMKAELEAQALGQRHGRAAASWVEPGDEATAAKIKKGWEEGDPAVLDLFRVPDLSGEFADSMTPGKLMAEVGFRGTPEEEQEIASAYEVAADEGFWDAMIQACDRFLTTSNPRKAHRTGTDRVRQILLDGGGVHVPYPEKLKKDECYICGHKQKDHKGGECHATGKDVWQGQVVTFECGVAPHEFISYEQVRAKNPGQAQDLTVIGKECILVKTDTEELDGPMGRILGCPDGSFIIEGLFPHAPQGKLLYVDYIDVGKAKAEGLNPPDRPWRHDFESENIKIKLTEAGLHISGPKRLWEVC